MPRYATANFHTECVDRYWRADSKPYFSQIGTIQPTPTAMAILQKMPWEDVKELLRTIVLSTPRWQYTEQVLHEQLDWTRNNADFWQSTTRRYTPTGLRSSEYSTRPDSQQHDDKCIHKSWVSFVQNWFFRSIQSKLSLGWLQNPRSPRSLLWQT